MKVRVKDVCCGRDHNLIIDENGNIWSWGYNYYGQCGNNTTKDIGQPQIIDTLKKMKIKEIQCGYVHSYCRTIILNLTKVVVPFFSHIGCRIACLAVLRSSTLHVGTQNVKSEPLIPSRLAHKSLILCNYHQTIMKNKFRMILLERKTANCNGFTFDFFPCKCFDFVIWKSKLSKSGTQNCKSRKFLINCDNYYAI